MAEYGSSNGGWVHDVAFNTDGTSVAWVSHNSSVGYAQAGGSSFSTLTSYLPFSGCHWTSPNTLVAVGFDCKVKKDFVTDLILAFHFPTWRKRLHIRRHL